MAPFKDCEECIATPWCKFYSGEFKPTKDFCVPKFRLERALRFSNIPKKYIEANIHNSKFTEEWQRDHIDNIVEVIDSGKNFLFIGNNTGTGKTYAATMLLNHYIYKTCLTDRFDFENPLAYFCVYTDLMDNLRYRRDEEYTQEELRIVKDVPLLFLDDVGADTNSEFTVGQTYQIINYRYNNGLSTIVASNYGRKEFSKYFGVRAVSRLVENCFLKEFTGDNLRIGKVVK